MVSNWDSDERRYNKRGGPSLYHKVRVIVGHNLMPIAYGVTLPFLIAQEFSGCPIRIHTSGTSIIMESGCRI